MQVRAHLREFWPIFSEEIVEPPKGLQSDEVQQQIHQFNNY
jgi:hypothetical protein